LGFARVCLVNNYPSLEFEEEGNTLTVFVLKPVLAKGQNFKACGPSKKQFYFERVEYRNTFSLRDNKFCRGSV